MYDESRDDNTEQPLPIADETPDVRPATYPPDVSHPQTFEDLSLAQVAGQFVRSPFRTLEALINIGGTPVNLPAPSVTIPAQPTARTVQLDAQPRQRANIRDWLAADRRGQMQLGLYISAFVMALWGCLILVSADTRREADQLHAGAPFLLAGFFIWLGAEIYADWDSIKVRWKRFRSTRETGQSAYDQSVGAQNAAPTYDADAGVRNTPVIWQGIHPVRVFAGLGALVFSLISWEGSINNHFSFFGFWGWVISIFLVVVATAPVSWNPANLVQQFVRWVSSLRFRDNWTLVTLIFICIVGAYFRLNNLAAVPPEMTSDHIEKLLDSQRVVEGDRDIFFTNNGGREGFQMYAMALLSKLPGMEMDFTTLKLLSVIEGLVTLPLLWWMGREVIGEKNRRLGNTVGLILAALVAVSYWHVAISRLALRIILTPLVGALLMIFLSRAMRYNRRGDYILAGLVLGFGLYAYQAVRMMPIVVVVGIGLAILFRWQDHKMRWRYVRNLAVLVVVSFVVFVPLFRFSVDYPNHFWMRTAGRLLGDDVIQETDTAGNIIERNATIEERLGAFQNNLPVLTSNIRNALLMYNWKGDVAWINGVPNYPVMDSITGAFLIVGAAAWLALMVRRRDPVLVLIPLMVVMLLLPSALSIAAPLENPSATRASGSLPPAYLIAALPLALIALKITDVIRGSSRYTLAGGVVVIAVVAAFFINTETYFHDYRLSYVNSWKPHSEPGQILRGFALSDGGYGNAFLIHHEHWLDHRIVGLEGGILDWENAIISRDKVPDFLWDAFYCVDYKYRIDPERDLLFFYNQVDGETGEQLKAWFPGGHSLFIESRLPQHSFYIFRAPAMGYDGFQTWLDEHKTDPRCWSGQ